MTSTEEDYIKAIFSIAQGTANRMVGTNDIAREMDTSAASVSDMLKKLNSKELVIYEKYKGVRLSPNGTERAMFLLRKHRLWESFLVNKLGFAWDEVHDIAEQLEHVKSNELVNKLDAFLGYPKFDPHGDPIPDSNGTITLRNQVLLNTLEIGDEGTLIGVKMHNKDFLAHLNGLDLNIGTSIKVTECFPFDNSLKIMVNGKSEAYVTEIISKNIYLKKTS